ncbi:MAG TPA: winged helix-turn-helix domain-containing protein [Candidatus Acidoferrales bacterium]|nr:winged helix-turn-helix domain-containing protein [Candidatus Acidoferrales bacterium]
MSVREQFQKLVDRKNQEIRDLELQIEKAKAYVQALQDSMRFLPKDNGQEETALRPGTALAQAREVLRKAGKPMHISEILKAINKPVDKKNRLSLSGSLSTYVRNGQIFTRPAPNTFGLIEMNKMDSSGSESMDQDNLDLPDDFGADK